MSGCSGCAYCSKQLFWEASLLAQMHHEEAEAMGRGTRGVHAFPDAAVHVLQFGNILCHQSSASGDG